MSLTLLGYIFVPVTLLMILMGKRNWLPWVLSAAMPFVQAPAIVLGANTISPFFVVSVAAACFVALGLVRGQLSHLVGLGATISIYFGLSAILLPLVFRGIPVLVPRGGIDAQVNAPGSLAFSLSNVAQIAYLVLGVAVVLFLANHRPRSLHFMNLGFILGTVLNGWSLVSLKSGLFFPYESIRAQEVGSTGTSFYLGQPRLVGIFAEPSYLATFAISALVFNIFMIGRTTPRWRPFVIVIVIVNLLCCYFSYSGTAVTSLLAFLAAFLGAYVLLFVSGRRRLHPRAALAGALAAVLAAFALPALLAFVNQIVAEKVVSVSYMNRTSSNAFSWDLFLQTSTLGSGLGSNRPSSFFFALISTVGVLGTLFFVILVGRVIREAVRTSELTPEIWCLIATLISKVIAEPNMSNPIMWLSIGACAVAFVWKVPAEGLNNEPEDSNGFKTQFPRRFASAPIG